MRACVGVYKALSPRSRVAKPGLSPIPRKVRRAVTPELCEPRFGATITTPYRAAMIGSTGLCAGGLETWRIAPSRLVDV
jgi:hypothetical protein